MRDLGRETIDERTIKALWLRLMPVTVTSVMAILETTDLDKMSQIADKILDNSKINEVSAINDSASKGHDQTMEEVLTQLKQMQLELSAIKNERSNNRSRNYHNYYAPRSTARSRSQERILCHFHRKFGKYAYRCEKPCDWKPAYTPKNQGN